MQRRTLWTLYVCNLLASVGFWFFLPLLPIFLSRRGGSATLVGAVFAAGLLPHAAVCFSAGFAPGPICTPPAVIAAPGFESPAFFAFPPRLARFPLPAVRG